MLLLSMLAPLAVLASEMPRGLAWPLALLAVAVGLGTAWREHTLPVLDVVIDTGGVAVIDGTPVEAFRIEARGPLMFVAWRHADESTARRSLWPDTLAPAARRELRLAVRGRGDGQPPPSMSP